MRPTPFKSKKFQKLSAGRCRLCGNDQYEVLDVHRVKAGANGGKYTYHNTVVICCECHRKEQAGLIKILGWYDSTAGRLLHIIREDGQEDFV